MNRNETNTIDYWRLKEAYLFFCEAARGCLSVRESDAVKVALLLVLQEKANRRIEHEW